MTRLAFLWLATSLLACDGGLLLSVDVRSDLRAGLDFSQVRTEVIQNAGAPGRVETSQSALVGVSPSDDFLAGSRVAEFELAEPGTYLIRASLLTLDGTVVLSRDARVTVSESFGITLILSSSCRGVVCPGPDYDALSTSCVGGRCVPPECSPRDPEACGAAECASDAECTASVSCAEGRCVDGYCLQAPIEGACGATEWCSVERGCVTLPGEDGGVPTCVPEAETCNGTDDDCDGAADEGFDLAADPNNCGECGTVCGGAHATASCSAGTCALACDDGWGNCNDDPADGCEADLSSGATCGGCGTTCADPTPLCVASGSAYSCEASCPPASPTLCGSSCVNLDTSLVHCGACDAACDPPGSTGECVAGTCRVADCDPGFADCTGGAADGCESDLSDPGTCGGCGTSCGASSPYCVPSGGSYACTDGCSDGVRGGDETDVDCGGSLCPACGSGSACGSDADCSGTLVCSAGRCASCGECDPGAMGSQACGMCGTQTRTCNASCAWNSWSACSGEGVCPAGAMESRGCGNCGSQTRTCSASCTWGSWSTCSGEGPCAPGAMESRGCGNCGTETRTCSGACTWNAWGGCAGEGVCAPGSTSNAGCPGACMAQTCTSSCTWDGVCDGCLSTCSTSYNQCGTSCSMAGYHVSSLSCSTSCTSGSCVSAPDNRAACQRSCGTSFNKCGIGCPTGYHPTSYSCTTSCTSGSCVSAPDNMSTCAIDQGTSFNSCGTSCPSGYYVSSRTCSTSCTSGSCVSAPDNMSTCRRVEGTSFNACGSSCPSGYAVSSSFCSTSCTSGSCVSAPNNMVTCRLI